MIRLEDLTKDATVAGVKPGATITVVDVHWHGSDVIELTYKDTAGNLGNELLYRDDESRLEIVTTGRPWSFDSDGNLYRLVAEAYRINMAHLFDPLLAVHTSIIDPLPHQITAVYEEMLPRQPLRFLLADDPGAGKTIMAGLFIKELFVRGALRRCLIVCPGSLVDQWQDELGRRFQLPFEIITRQTIEASRTGNPFLEKHLVIARLDHLSRNEEIQEKLKLTDWDLIVCDEAHKMSASFFGGEVKYTKRYQLGQLLGGLTRHFLLMTATPHNGKEEDFQLFLALLDADRFEGKFRDGVHQIDPDDLIRRLVKENMLKFDGTRLFPERRAYTVTYDLSDLEASLYADVTNYVREEMNRADRLQEEGQGRHGAVVGFAMTSLQRRLASSPEAIYQSLRRRRERLEKRLREEEILRRGSDFRTSLPKQLADLDPEDYDDLDDIATAEELEEIQEELVDQASSARTIKELEAEITTLQRLEKLALQVRHSGTDRKWEELSSHLQTDQEMFDATGARRKLIVFTEHRDTLRYLEERIGNLLGDSAAVVTIHGSMGREDRRKMQELFTQDKDVHVLVATDAAGEGINLQRAHLMVNYDLPWNPNRIEQRFGRIHRIGQTEVCHLWNLVATETREGDVFKRLFEKLEVERAALGDQVFDVLGQVFAGAPLRSLLLEAIRYGDQPEIQSKLMERVDGVLDHQHLRDLLESHQLVQDALDTSKVRAIRDDMERAAASRLQPHFIRSFFIEAFKQLGGKLRERESGRYEIGHVPAAIRARDRLIGVGDPVLNRYERVCFEKHLISVHGKPSPAAFIAPGHPLLEATLELILERHLELLKRGTILVDPEDSGTDVRVLVTLEHSLRDGLPGKDGGPHIISRRLQFVTIDERGTIQRAGAAPYLDFRPIEDSERELVEPVLKADWLKSHEFERRAVSFANGDMSIAHRDEIRSRKREIVELTRNAVKDRLTKEINFWDTRARQLRNQEEAGKNLGKLNAELARRRADELEARLQSRLRELAQEEQISALPAVVVGGALIVPQRLLEKLGGHATLPDQDMRERIDRLAIEAVLAAERNLGNEPRELEHNHPGYDIESKTSSGALRFIEVKGKGSGQDVVTISRSQILTALNAPEQFILAIVPIDGEVSSEPRYVRQPFAQEPEFGVVSWNIGLTSLLERAEAPR